MTTYHEGRGLAIFCGAIATGGALTILLADPVMNQNWRLDHVLLPLIVCITISMGHLASVALRRWHILSATLFGLAFLGGLLVTVYASVGAQKSGPTARQEKSIASHNETLSDKKTQLDRARKRETEARTMADREMTGEACGRRCNDWRLREKEAAAHAAQIERQIVGLGSEQITPSRAKPFAEAAAVFGLNRDQVETIASTFEPFAFSLLFELTAILAFGYGFRPRRRDKAASAEIHQALTYEKPLTEDEIEELKKLILGAGRPLSNGELAKIARISPSEASKRVSAGVARGILNRTRAGREVAITVH